MSVRFLICFLLTTDVCQTQKCHGSPSSDGADVWWNWSCQESEEGPAGPVSDSAVGGEYCLQSRFRKWSVRTTFFFFFHTSYYCLDMSTKDRSGE